MKSYAINSKCYVFIFSSIVFFSIFWIINRPIEFDLKNDEVNKSNFFVFKSGKYQVTVYSKDSNTSHDCIYNFQNKKFYVHDDNMHKNSFFNFEIKNRKNDFLPIDRRVELGRITGSYATIFGEVELFFGGHEMNYKKIYAPCVIDFSEAKINLVYKKNIGYFPLFIVIGERVSFIAIIFSLIFLIINVLKVRCSL